MPVFFRSFSFNISNSRNPESEFLFVLETLQIDLKHLKLNQLLNAVENIEIESISS